MQLPKYSKDSMFFGDENAGFKITSSGDLFVYDKGEKRMVLGRNTAFTLELCKCESGNDVTDGFYHCDELEISTCQKCGKIIAKASCKGGKG